MPQTTKNELKTGDRLEAGTLTIDWEKRTFEIRGCAGFPEGDIKPYLVREHLMRHERKEPSNVEKFAIVAFDTSDGELQVAIYDREEYEAEVYGPVEHQPASS